MRLRLDGSHNNKDVVVRESSASRLHGTRTTGIDFLLRANEGELGETMRDAWKHAANLCQVKDPKFPK